MVWDGECSFCAYWIGYWQGLQPGFIDFEPYSTAAERFKDIDNSHFKEASRLIDNDGRIYSGPDSAYKSLSLMSRLKWLHNLYQANAIFRFLSDQLYQLIANNRNFFFKLTKLLFGSDPQNLRPFWTVYLFAIIFLILI